MRMIMETLEWILTLVIAPILGCLPGLILDILNNKLISDYE